MNKKFDKIDKGNIAYTNREHGPCFGDGGGCMYLKKNLNEGFTKNYNFLTNCELTHGEEGDFKVEEFEAFKVIFH